jgi:hypothetical protein
MANMSYCKFENTVHDFQYCIDELDEDRSFESLSKSEKSYAEKLYELAKTYVEIFESIEDEG